MPAPETLGQLSLEWCGFQVRGGQTKRLAYQTDHAARWGNARRPIMRPAA